MSHERSHKLFISSFFFQAEDGIRDSSVTGVQTCALPISFVSSRGARNGAGGVDRLGSGGRREEVERGRLHRSLSEAGGSCGPRRRKSGKNNCHRRGDKESRAAPIEEGHGPAPRQEQIDCKSH